MDPIFEPIFKINQIFNAAIDDELNKTKETK